MKWAYYNDTDPFCCEWIRNLIKVGLVMDGEVDERSIAEVQPEDLRGFRRVHMFAGLGGWDYALRLAGWTRGREVWTGSCPCQPFSTAGKRKGAADKRHLWPEFARLVRLCRPATIFGEQVPGAIRLEWLDGVFDDLEAEGYACGAVVLGAHSVGAPHIRQRVYWVANSGREGPPRLRQAQEQATGPDCPGQRSEADRLADAERAERRQTSETGIHDDDGNHARGSQAAGGLELCGENGRLADAERDGSGPRRAEREGQQREPALVGADFWSDYSLVACRDGKTRRIPPVESGIFPLAYGLPGRVGKLRAAGNAIVPQVAAAFVRAWMEIE